MTHRRFQAAVNAHQSHPGLLAVLWAAPVTLVGLGLGLPLLLTGAQTQAHSTHLEISGGFIGRALGRRLGPSGYAAITLGHVVLAVDEDALTPLRPHEQVHVSQYTRWGLLFPFTYLLASAVQWARGNDPYLDNPFER